MHVTHLMVSVEQREETIPVIQVIVHPKVPRNIDVCQHPVLSGHSHQTVDIWSKFKRTIAKIYS